MSVDDFLKKVDAKIKAVDELVRIKQDLANWEQQESESAIDLKKERSSFLGER